ncbi:hypothetical protein OJJOAM_001964 [Cupriavidus sp. H18C1]
MASRAVLSMAVAMTEWPQTSCSALRDSIVPGCAGSSTAVPIRNAATLRPFSGLMRQPSSDGFLWSRSSRDSRIRWMADLSDRTKFIAR